MLRTQWDFSRVRPALVPSLAGKHEGWAAVLKSGHTALMRATNRLNPQQRAVSLEYQVGSAAGKWSLSRAYADPHTGIVHWSVQLRMARRVLAFCAWYQPRKSAQCAEITARGYPDACFQHAEDIVPDAGVGARLRAR